MMPYKDASMGPRSFERGNEEGIAQLQHMLAWLQWGRVRLNAEISVAAMFLLLGVGFNGAAFV